MLIARVVGDITATQKHPSHEGAKLLLVQPLELDGTDRGAPVIAIDSVDAGIGDRVLLVQDGFAAMTAAQRPQSPIDSAIVGVIDHIELSAANPVAESPKKPALRNATRKSRV